MVDSLFVYILLLVLPLLFFFPASGSCFSQAWLANEKKRGLYQHFGLFAHFPIHVDGKAIAINLFIF